jgi:hypothetical protein
MKKSSDRRLLVLAIAIGLFTLILSIVYQLYNRHDIEAHLARGERCSIWMNTRCVRWEHPR